MNFGDVSNQASEVLLRQWRHEVDESAFQPLDENVEIINYTETRNHFKFYFMGPGKVPWQDMAVDEGNM